MIIKTRGSQIEFTQMFTDADGVDATVVSATMTIVYPSGITAGVLLRQSPGVNKTKETLVMTSNVDGSWSATWDSSVSDPGTVYWNAVSATPKLVEDGEIVLRANLANMEAF